MHGDAIKDANGLPPNLHPPRNRWLWDTQRCAQGHLLAVHVFRQRYDDIAVHFADAFVHKWWSWQVHLCLCGRTLVVWRWRERYAV